MAKRFRFRLEVVERIRRQHRDQHRRIVAEAVRASRQMEEHVASLSDQLRRSVGETVRSQRLGTLDVAVIRTHEYHRNWLHRQMVSARMELARRQEDLASKRCTLAEATKQLRVIEKLHERQWLRHRRAVRREEQSISDEMAVTGYRRAAAAAAQGRVE